MMSISGRLEVLSRPKKMGCVKIVQSRSKEKDWETEEDAKKGGGGVKGC